MLYAKRYPELLCASATKETLAYAWKTLFSNIPATLPTSPSTNPQHDHTMSNHENENMSNMLNNYMGLGSGDGNLFLGISLPGMRQASNPPEMKQLIGKEKISSEYQLILETLVDVYIELLTVDYV